MMKLEDVKLGMKVKVLSKTWYGRDELSIYDNYRCTGKNMYNNGAYVVDIEDEDGRCRLTLALSVKSLSGNFFTLEDIEPWEYDKMFTKADLKDGMILTYRDGTKAIYLNGVVTRVEFLTGGGFNVFESRDICAWENNLMFYSLGNSRGDIMKITCMNEVLFERDEKVYYTLEEAVFSGKKFKHKDSKKEFGKNLGYIINCIDYMETKEILEEMNKKVWEVED